MLGILKKSKFEKETWLIVGLIVIAVAARWLYVSGGNFMFYFDQARDAYLSRQIYESRDFKIQGPSASGTNESLYHGVLYYYVIGLAYFMGNGSPVVATFFLSLLTASAVVPVYLLAKKILKDWKWASMVGVMYGLSMDTVMYGTLLSNTTLAVVFMPWLYLVSYGTTDTKRCVFYIFSFSPFGTVCTECCI